MSRIDEAESIKDKIRNHSHYFKCFYWSDNYYYTDYCDYANKLNHYRFLYDNMSSYEKDIISKYYDKKNKENELNNKRRELQNEINNLEKYFKYKEKIVIKNN